MTTTTVNALNGFRFFGLRDAATYRRTAHVLLDLPVGIAAFTVAVSFVATSAALATTLVGLPLLAVTLAGARWFGWLERRRAKALLGLGVPEPAARPHGWRRLTDATGWRSVMYAVAILPIGVVTSTVAISGWSVAAAAFTYPAYAPFLDRTSVSVGSTTFGGAGAQLVTSVAGALLLMAMPSVIGGVARVDAALVRRLLR